ncbi:MAG: hypothetical protein M1816_007199 [Peltula sp. TS41687]|nr:MAG: hypothetical protein M1816_007199 [Peltula sp. TS41687]
MTSKVVVTGDINGRFPEVFKKLSPLHSKNSFSFAIICGDLFADPSISSPEDEENITALLHGSIPVPLTTYFSVGKRPLPPRVIEKLDSADDELCENLHYLGKRTVLNVAGGIKIVALGGHLDPLITAGITKEEYTPFHTDSDMKSLQGVKDADILLTSSWPASIRKGSTVSLLKGASEPPSSDLIANLCSSLRPRYHFSTSSEFFFEREPFFHRSEDDDNITSRQITRFISLASFGNSAKQKWLYAFNIDTSIDRSAAPPAGVTASPFHRPSKKRAAPSGHSRFSTSDSHRPSKRARQPPPRPEECFFCLSNPNIATHLIASIGNDSYLTTARGPLSSPKTFPSIGFSAHILIIPLSHSPTLSSITEPTVRSSTIVEMSRYRKALQSMIHSQSKGQLGSVTWEVSRKKGVHAHWQFLPLSNDLVSQGLVEAAFKVEAENENYPAFEKKEPKVDEDETMAGDFFRIWISGSLGPDKADPAHENGSSGNDSSVVMAHEEKCLVSHLSDDARFDVQFGRRVVAKLLGLEDRMNWKDCLQSQEEETADVEAFKAAFHDLDFSLQE